MSSSTMIIGDTRDVMATMPDGSVDLVLTSPPFLALRSYLPAGHPDKHKEIGSEPTPAEFLDTLLALTAEWGRLIAPHGSIAVELGDTYAGSGGAGGDCSEGGLRESQQAFSGSAKKRAENGLADGGRPSRASRDDGWPLAKSMCLIPHAYAMSLAYGRNILTGQPSPAGMWRVRNVVAWCRPNPAVGALGDKYRPATSFMVIATRAVDRWFDLDAVRVPADPANKRPSALVRKDIGGRTDQVCNPLGEDGQRIISNAAGAPPLDHVGLRNDEADLFIDDAWLVSTESYSGSHYATWPRKLLGQPILSMCPKEVCTACGEPRRRMVGEPTYVQTRNGGTPAILNMREGQQVDALTKQWLPTAEARGDNGVTRQVETLGWTDCGCGAPFRRGHVLDPFGGSGTTAVVATGLGRDCTLIDLDERNADLAQERVGMFLTVHHHNAVEAS